MKDKKYLFIVFIILITIPVILAGYERSNPQYTNSNIGSDIFGFTGQPDEQCQMGQDFVIQVAPFGCTPPVVRSDLLEDQDVPVFCQLAATKINPLISVDAIESLDFVGGFPEEVSDVGFMPNRDALRTEVGKLNSIFLDNIGYAVIILKQQRNGSMMPDYVDGKIRTKLYYDIENAFGVGQQSFYLPEMSEAEWNKDFVRYSFWSGKGYLRAEDVSEDSARITLYNDARKLQTFDLNVGEKSNKFYMPGFDCLAGLSIGLDALDYSDTRARISINGNYEDVRDDEVFLDGFCKVTYIDKKGMVERVGGTCRTDEGSRNFVLSITPKVKLKICESDGTACTTGEYGLGDILYKDLVDENRRNVFLGYIGKRVIDNFRSEYFILPTMSTEQTKNDFLNAFSDSGVTKYYGNLISRQGGSRLEFANFVNNLEVNYFGVLVRLANGILSGSDFGEWVEKGETKNVNFISQEILNLGDKFVSVFFGSEEPLYDKKQITFIDFVGAVDLEFDDSVNGQKAKAFYQKAIVDYDRIVEAYPSLDYDIGNFKDKGEQALYAKIMLSYKLGQKNSMLDYCNEFKEKYPESERVKELFEVGEKICNDPVKASSSDINSVSFVIGGRVKELSLVGIFEPKPEEYSVYVNIDQDPYVFLKDEEKILNIGAGQTNTKTTVKNKVDEDDLRQRIINAWGENSPCLDYAKEVVEFSDRANVDPVLVMAIMKGESECRPNAENKNVVDGKIAIHSSNGMQSIDNGLMQVNNIHCTKTWDGIKLSSSQSECMNQLKDVETNIRVGIAILKDEFSESEVLYECHPDGPVRYKEWAAALRGYNGWNDKNHCDRGNPEYVDDILKLLDELGGNIDGTSVETTYTSTRPETIKLKKLEKDYAVFDVSGIDHTAVTKLEYDPSNLKIPLGATRVVGSVKHRIIVTDISLKKVAKVSVIPSIDYAQTETNLSFRIGIEKRGIQLSPDKIRKKIDTLNLSIADWTEKSDKLGKIVKGLKGACLGVNAYLVVKNFFANTKGKAMARTEVMRGENGWYDRCVEEVRKRESSSIEGCLSKNADLIDEEVEAYYQGMLKQNKENQALQKACESNGILGEVVVNDDCFGPKHVDKVKEGLAQKISAELDKDGDGKVVIDNEEIEIDKFVDDLSYDKTTIKELRELELHADLSGSGSSEFNEMISKQLEADIKEIHVNTAKIIERQKWEDKSGFPEVHVYSFGNKVNQIPFSRDVRFSEVSAKYDPTEEISGDTLVQNFKDGNTGEEYVLLLDSDNVVTRTYKVTGTNPTTKELILTPEFKKDNKGNVIDSAAGNNPLDLFFKKYDRGTYENPYKASLGEAGPRLKYYETEPYAGFPAIVPFDLDEGWYASIKQTLPIGGSIASYSDSGRVESFYLCNVGTNKMEENRGGDDICQMINTGTGMSYNQFAGLPSAEAEKLVDDAVEAISDASRQHGNKNVEISTSRGTFNIVVGDPAADIPDMKCEDIMSPKDCKLLFNVCDPVICPPSRCDLGGAYPVKDVIQSGLFGSIVLCLPNSPEVYVPVCLTGIKAGIDGLLSVQKSYRDCLEHNLETGETIGMCDQLHSVYLCEFFWRQGIPFAKLLLPKLLEISAGQSSRGGGEYLGVQSAWQNAEKSVEYFTQYYASNSHAAFEAQTLDEAGTEVCKASVSAVLPGGDAMLDIMTEPDSPPQFTGRFEEIPFSSVTNPPLSHYKVFYHIYAGDDIGVYYKVYLKGSETGTYYQDTGATRVIGTDYIPVGEYATDTVDFTAPAGYKELCIMVNEQIECGFGQVSTDFGLNYIEDKYLEEQASQENIESETECVAGSRSLYSLLNPSIQEGADDLINPDMYNHGIIRICATKNPGLSTDGLANMNGSRWVDVGYCDDKNMRCWLDTYSVKDVIKNSNILDGVLEDQYEQFVEKNLQSGKYLDESKFSVEVANLEKTSVDTEPETILVKIEELTDLMGKVMFLTHKAQLFYLRAEEYAKLAKIFYGIWEKDTAPEETPEDKDSSQSQAKDIIENNPELAECAKKISKDAYEAAAVLMQKLIDEKGYTLDYLCNLNENGLLNLYSQEFGEASESEVNIRTDSAVDRGEVPYDNNEYMIIRIDDDSMFSTDMKYRFTCENWWWSLDESTWTPVPKLVYTNNQMLTGEKAEFIRDDLSVYYDNYYGGFSKLVDRVLGSDGYDLETEYVEMDSSGRVIFRNRVNGKDLYFKYFDTFNNQVYNDWTYSFNGRDFTKIDSLENIVYDSSTDSYYNGEINSLNMVVMDKDTQEYFDIFYDSKLYRLSHRSMYDGLFYLFHYETELHKTSAEDHLTLSFSSERVPYTYDTAITKAGNLFGSYNEPDNKEFVKHIFQDGLITAEQLDEIDGGLWGIDAENMEYVKNLLISNRAQLDTGYNEVGTEYVAEINGHKLHFSYDEDTDDWIYDFGYGSYKVSEYETDFSDTSFKTNLISVFTNNNAQTILIIIKSINEASGFDEEVEIIKDGGAEEESVVGTPALNIYYELGIGPNINEEIYLNFEKAWRWSENNRDWYYEAVNLDNIHEFLVPVIQNIVTKKTYSDGIEYLVEWTDTKASESIIPPIELKTDRVKMNDMAEFEFVKEFDAGSNYDKYKLTLKYDGGWLYKFDLYGAEFKSISESGAPYSHYNRFIKATELYDLVSKDLYEGSEIIFSFEY